MLGALMGTMVTGGTMPLPAGFVEANCTFIHSIADTQASSTYSLALTNIEQTRVGRTVNNILTWQNTLTDHSDGNVNYVVFAKTSNEGMGILEGSVADGQPIPVPVGVFINTFSFVSTQKISTNYEFLGLKYLMCEITLAKKASSYCIRADQTVQISGYVNFVTIGIP
jgi:hypothetical protein